MLLRQHGGRHQDGHLFAIHHGLEGRPQRNLGFAVAHIAAQQAVHRAHALHIRLHILDGAQLVFRLHVGEAGFQVLLPDGVRRKGMPLHYLPPGIQLQQLLGHLLHRLAHLLLDLRPFPAAQAGGRGRLAARADIAAQPVGLVDRNEDLVAALVFYRKGTRAPRHPACAGPVPRSAPRQNRRAPPSRPA